MFVVRQVLAVGTPAGCNVSIPTISKGNIAPRWGAALRLARRYKHSTALRLLSVTRPCSQ